MQIKCKLNNIKVGSSRNYKYNIEVSEIIDIVCSSSDIKLVSPKITRTYLEIYGDDLKLLNSLTDKIDKEIILELDVLLEENLISLLYILKGIK